MYMYDIFLYFIRGNFFILDLLPTKNMWMYIYGEWDWWSECVILIISEVNKINYHLFYEIIFYHETNIYLKNFGSLFVKFNEKNIVAF